MEKELLYVQVTMQRHMESLRNFSCDCKARRLLPRPNETTGLCEVQTRRTNSQGQARSLPIRTPRSGTNPTIKAQQSQTAFESISPISDPPGDKEKEDTRTNPSFVTFQMDNKA